MSNKVAMAARAAALVAYVGLGATRLRIALAPKAGRRDPTTFFRADP
jgi:hypothetical protein